MAVKIRLSRIGKKHVPVHRIVAIDSRKKRDGAFLEDLGTYDPIKHKMVRFNQEALERWLSVGAQPSDTVKKIYQHYKRAQKPAAEPAKKAVKKITKKTQEKSVAKAVAKKDAVTE